MSKRLLNVLGCVTAAIVILGLIFSPGAFAALSAQRGLYAIDETTDSFYKIDPVSGVTTLIGPCNLDLSYSGLAYDTSTGIMYVSDIMLGGGDWGLGTIDLTTGQVTIIGSHVTSEYIEGLAYDSINDILYGSETDNNGLATIDRATGEATFVGLFVAAGDIRGLAYCPVNDTLYGIDNTNLYTINRTTGEATLVGAHGIATANYIGLEYDENTGRLYAGYSNDLNAYTLNLSTGSASAIPGYSTGIHISGLASIPSTGSRSVLYINTLGGNDNNFLTGLQGIDIDGLTLVDARYMTPSTTYMQDFDVVLVASNSAFADQTTMGDNLADYVDAGGGVCLYVATLSTAGPYGLAGRITTSAYSPMLPVGGAPGAPSTSVSFEAHPITSGVTSLSTTLPIQFTSTQGTGQSLGDYDTGFLLGAYSPDKPIAVINVYTWGSAWGGDLIKMTENAINWMAPRPSKGSSASSDDGCFISTLF